MPTYHYQHPNTFEIFEIFRSFDDRDKPYISEDGADCQYIPWYLLDDAPQYASKHPKGLVDKHCEPWEKDPDYVKKLNPKYVRTRSGNRLRYDPTKMQ